MLDYCATNLLFAKSGTACWLGPLAKRKDRNYLEHSRSVLCNRAFSNDMKHFISCSHVRHQALNIEFLLDIYGNIYKTDPYFRFTLKKSLLFRSFPYSSCCRIRVVRRNRTPCVEFSKESLLLNIFVSGRHIST